MKKFLFGFWIFILLYHIIVTVVGYKFLDWNYIQEIAIIKDAIRILVIGFFFLKHKKDRKSYFQKRKYPRIFFLITIIFSIWISFLQEKSIYNMIIGLKYDFHFLFIFLSATFIGYFRPKDKKNKKGRFWWINFLSLLQYTLGIVLIVGFIRQFQRITLSDTMISNLGYWPVGDFAFGENPPVYYRTWPGWFPRLQWIFAWPNNYWYFLVIFLPIILLRRKPKKYKELLNLNPEKLLHFGLIILRLIAIILTISRTAFIGALLGLIFFHKDKLKQISKQTKTIWFIIFFTLLIWVSIRKRWSTKAHLTSKIQGIISVINEPLWQWLGTAWPAIFHKWSILPENFFLQLMVDIWTIGFLIWIFSIFHILIIQNKIYNYHKTHNWNAEEQLAFLQRNYLNLWRSCFLIMGLFLHVFEDSMVNYLFFIPYGILTWYLSTKIKIPQKISIINTLKELKK